MLELRCRATLATAGLGIGCLKKLGCPLGHPGVTCSEYPIRAAALSAPEQTPHLHHLVSRATASHTATGIPKTPCPQSNDNLEMSGPGKRDTHTHFWNCVCWAKPRLSAECVSTHSLHHTCPAHNCISGILRGWRVPKGSSVGNYVLGVLHFRGLFKELQPRGWL